MRWPDATRTVVKYLDASLEAWIASRLPSDLEVRLPVVRVTRGPGSDDTITDFPQMDIEVFAATEAAMWSLAEDAREAMHLLGGRAVDGVLVDMVRTVQAPVQVTYAPNVWRAVATYRLALRKR